MKLAPKNATALYVSAELAMKTRKVKEAKKLYKENCVECHGVDGSANTARAKELKPPPSNFRDPSVMAALSLRIQVHQVQKQMALGQELE